MSRLFYTQLVVFIVFAVVLAAANGAMAACATPTANSGALEYFTGTDEYKFCDGATWVAIPVDSTLAACTNTGGIEWDATEKSYKFCDSANYKTWGCTPGDCVSNGLVSHWKLDETSGTLVDSVGSNDGTATNTPTYNVTGKVDSGMQFDGVSDEHVLVTDDASLDFGTTSFSYGGWFYPTAYPEGYTIPFFKGGTSGGSHGYDIEWSRADTGDYTEACLSDGTVYCSAFMTGEPTLNVWHHMFVTVDTGYNELKTYRNGVLFQTVDITALGSLDNAFDLRIGIGNGNGSDFQGTIDDVRVYNRVVSPTEVFALYACHADAADITSNLQGHWALDESAGTNASDETANGYDGTLNGNPTWNSTGGAIGGAIDFDGTDDRVQLDVVSDTANLEINGDLTVAAWVKTSQSNSSGAQVILQDTSSVNNNYQLELDSGSPRLYHGNGSTSENFTATATVNDDSWHHVAAVADYPNLYFYIDGVLDSGSPHTMTFDIINVNGNEFKIGTTGTTYAFDGLIDDVRVYDRAFSAADMKALFELGEADITTNLNGHWKFDESAGTTAADSSGNGYDGTIFGNPAWSPSGGVVDGALVFDGTTDVVRVPTGPMPTGDFTISAWIKPDDLAYRYLWGIRGGSGIWDGIWNNPWDGEIRINGTYVLNPHAGFLADSIWQHFVMTRSGSVVTVYRNSVVQATATYGTAFNDNSCDLAIGANLSCTGDTTGSAVWDGSIDEFRVYGRGLNARDVWELYQLGDSFYAPCKLGAACTTEGAIDAEGAQLKSCDGTNYKVIAE